LHPYSPDYESVAFLVKLQTRLSYDIGVVVTDRRPVIQTPVYFGDPPQQFSFPTPLLSLVTIGIGVIIASLGYSKRQNLTGAIALGAGSSIAGTGVVLLLHTSAPSS
jgi:hypothetical protein